MKPGELSDAQVFGESVEELSDAEVFGEDAQFESPEAVKVADEGVDRDAVRAKQEQYESENPPLKRAGQRLKLGYENLKASVYAQRVMGGADALAEIGTDEIQIQGAEDTKAKLAESVRQDLIGLITTQAKAATIPRAPVVTEGEGKGIGGALKSASVDPVAAVAQFGMESAPASALMLATGVAGARRGGIKGGMAGAGLGSGLVDYAAEVAGELSKLGIDPSDHEAVSQALSNPEVLKDMAARSTRHAVPVAIMDALSLGLATKVIAPTGLGKVAREAINIPAQAAVQGTAGAAGEIGGQVARSGEIEDPSQAVGEFLGEGLTAPLEAAGVAAAGLRKQPPQTAPPPAPVPQLPAPPPITVGPDGEAVTPEQARNRTDLGLTPDVVAATRQRGPLTRAADMAAQTGLTGKFKAPDESTAQPPGPTEPPGPPPGAAPVLDPDKVAPPVDAVGTPTAPKPGELTDIDLEAATAATSQDNNLPEPTAAQKEAENYRVGKIKAGLIPAIDSDVSIENPKDSYRFKIDQEGLQDLIDKGRVSGPAKATLQSAITALKQNATVPAAFKQIEQAVTQAHRTRQTSAATEIGNILKHGWVNKMTAHYGRILGTTAADGDHVDVFVNSKRSHDKSLPVFIVDQINPKTGEFDEHKTLVGYESEQAAREGYLSNYAPGWKGLGAITAMSQPQFKEWLKGDTTKAVAFGKSKERPSTVDVMLQAIEKVGKPRFEELVKLHMEQFTGEELEEAERAAEIEGVARNVIEGAYDEDASVTKTEKPDVLRDLLAVERDKYEDSNEYTHTDLVDAIEEIAEDSNDPLAQELLDAVETYRQEQLDDRELKGRGDMDSAEAAFDDVLDRVMRKAGKAGRQHKSESTSAREQNRYTGKENRRDTARRQTIDAMSAEEREMAIFTDPLTGLLNRRAFEHDAPKPFMASFDLDNFKWFNDNMGHATGDKVLQTVADAMRAAGMEGYRLGGDEFVVYGENEADLDRAMQKLSRTLAGAAIEISTPDGGKLIKRGIGVSYGIAENIEEADKRLYADKARRIASGERTATSAETPPGVTREAPEEAAPEVDAGPAAGVKGDEDQSAEDIDAQRKAEQKHRRELAAQKRHRQFRSVDQEKDTILVAIAKLGGLDAAEAKAQGIDPAHFRQQIRPGYPIFRREGGRSFDGMAEVLSEYGYGSENYSANELLDMVSSELGGRDVHSKYWVPVDTREEEEYDLDRYELVEDLDDSGDDLGRRLLEMAESIKSLGPQAEDDVMSILERTEDDKVGLEQLTELARKYAEKGRRDLEVPEKVEGKDAGSADRDTTEPPLLAPQAVTPDKPRQPPATQVDLFGNANPTKQAIHDARLERERRIADSPDVGIGAGDLFSGKSKQVDIEDKTKPSANKVFTEDAAAKARALLKSKLDQLNTGIDPEIMQAGLTLAGYHIERGARTFAAYAKAMIEDLGEAVRPYLKSWYAAVKLDPRAASLSGDMDSLASVEAASIEADEDGLPAGWSEADHGGMMTNPDKELGGIIDSEIASGKWFVIPNDDELGSLDGFSSRQEAFVALQRAIKQKVQPSKGARNVTDKRSSKALERDRGTGEPAEQVGEEGVRAGPDADGGTRGRGGQEDEGTRVESGVGVSGREAAAAGKRGDFSPYAEAPGTETGPTGDLFDQGSSDAGLDGAPVEPGGAEETEETVEVPVQKLAERRRAQTQAQSVPVRLGDADNIDSSLPYLYEGQRSDVLKAERRFAKPDGYGIIYTNGTGTGKTASGLGIVKRFERQGKKNILIVVPRDKIAADWRDFAKNLNLDVTAIADTRSNGQGIVVTTYANFGQNRTLADREWDLVVADESHYLMQAKDGRQTDAIRMLRAITLHPRGIYDRHALLNRELLDKESLLKEELKHAIDIVRDPNTKPEDAAAAEARFDKLDAEINKLRPQIEAAREAVEKDVMSRQGEKRPRVVFLSATPLAYEKTTDYLEGYLFEYEPESTGGGYNSGSPFDRFMMTHFGYRMRYNKLTEPDSNVDRGLMQRQFNSWLKQQGVLSGRMLDVEKDYDRRFVQVDSQIGTKIDEGLDWLWEQKKYYEIWRHIRKSFDHLTRRYILEAIKAEAVLPIVKEQLKAGRKVVIFHDFKKGGAFNPFDLTALANSEGADSVSYTDDNNQIVSTTLPKLAQQFMHERPDLATLPLEKMRSPLVAITKEFPDALIFNGDVPKAKRREAATLFQNEGSGRNLILVQSAAGKEGISLHDTTGNMPRVLYNLGLPTQPTTAIQQEGRIYRIGQASDAMFRYLNTGTNWERMAFAETIARRSSTAENLALGEQARALLDGFIQAYEESDTYPVGHEGEGKGGKARDAAANAALSEWDRARTMYFAQRKKTSRDKAQEGIDYFATPEPLGLKMVEWANIGKDENMLEPSAGHGAIARWFPDLHDRTVVEPSAELASRLKMVSDAKLLQERFEDLHTVNKFDIIVMNPPFGTAGKTAMDHLAKAAMHLRDGGRIVALIPRGSAMDKRFDQWLYEEATKPVKPLATHPEFGPIYKGDTIEVKSTQFDTPWIVASGTPGQGALFMTKPGLPAKLPVMVGEVASVKKTGPRTETYHPAENIYLAANILLPSVTFERAGTSVSARVVVLDKQTDKEAAKSIQQQDRDYTDAKDIKAFFERIKDSDIRPRTKAVAGTKKPEGRPSSDATPAEPAATYETDAPEITYVTLKGKTLKGVIATGLTQDQAKAIDPFSWKKDGGYFIRMKYVKRPASLSRGGASKGLSVKAVEAIVAPFRQKWKGAEIHVVATPEQIPESALPSDTEGAHTGDGKVWLVASQLPTAERVKQVLAHEAVGHLAAEELLPSKLYRRAIHRAVELANTNPVFRKLADEVDRTQPGLGRVRRGKEILAVAVETGTYKKDNILKRLVNDLLLRVKNLLRVLGLKLELSEGEIWALLRQAEKRLEGTSVEQELTDGAKTVAPAALSRRKPTGDPAVDALLSKIGAAPRTLKQHFDDIMDGMHGEIQQGLFDHFYGLKAAVDETDTDIHPERNPYIAARLTTSMPTQMLSVMRHGPLIFRHGMAQTRAGYQGLLDIFKPVADNLDLWGGYMIAKRAQRLKREGRENLLTDADIQAGLKLGRQHPEFQTVADEWAKFNAAMLDFAEQAGLINPAERALWEHADYIPFYRIADDAGAVMGPRGKKGVEGQAAGIFRLKGGMGNLNDPLENILKNVAHLIDASMKNRAAALAVGMLRGTDFISKAPHTVAPEIVPTSQVKTWLANQGVNVTAFPPDMFSGLAKMFAIQAPAGKNVIRIMVQGKPQWYQVHDDLLLRSLTSLNDVRFGAWMKAFSAPKRFLTKMVTADPSFMAANFIRDTTSSFVLGRDQSLPALGSVKGLIESMRDTGVIRQIEAAGAGFHGGYVHAGDPKALAETLKAEMRHRNIKTTVLSSPRKLWDFWMDISYSAENANRIKVANAALKAGKPPIKAVFEAKDLMDFSMRGDWSIVQFLTSTVPFLGARIQGLHRVGRGFLENKKAFTLKASMVMLAGLALYLRYRDDDRYKELEDWDKNTYYHWWIGDHHFRLPKPFEIGAVFGTIPERLTEYFMSDHPEAGKEFWKQMSWVLGEVFNFGSVRVEGIPVPIPQTLVPPAEIWANKSGFTQRPVIPGRLKDLPPADQYQPWTSATARELGESLNMSPLKIEHLFKGYFGTIGAYGLGAMDVVTRRAADYPEQPQTRLEDMPVIKRFYKGTGPERHTVYETRFYELLTELDKTYNSVLMQRGIDSEEFDKRLDENEDSVTRARNLHRVRDNIGRLNNDMRAVWVDRDMSAEEKRAKLNEIQVERSEAFREALEEDLYERTE